MASTKALVTVQQLYEMGSDARFELVRGELVPLSPVSPDHGFLVIRLGAWLYSFVSQSKLGWVGTETGFILSRDPDVVRSPDVHFVQKQLKTGAGFYSGAPDLAVEILSPSDKASDTQEKVREYLAAGTRLVWLVDPQSKTITTYRPTGDVHLCSGDQEVSGEDVLPGFSFRCRDLFLFD